MVSKEKIMFKGKWYLYQSVPLVWLEKGWSVSMSVVQEVCPPSMSGWSQDKAYVVWVGGVLQSSPWIYSMVFRPRGSSVFKRWIQLLSQWRRNFSLVSDGRNISSRTWISTSLAPLWWGKLKCAPIGNSTLFLFMCQRCAENLSFILFFVCPTYCMPQVLQVIQ